MEPTKYSVLDIYSYPNKSSGYKILDEVASPVCSLLGGRKIDVFTGESKKMNSSGAVGKVVAAIVLLVLFPVTIVSAVALGIKCLKAKTISENIETMEIIKNANSKILAISDGTSDKTVEDVVHETIVEMGYDPTKVLKWIVDIRKTFFKAEVCPVSPEILVEIGSVLTKYGKAINKARENVAQYAKVPSVVTF